MSDLRPSSFGRGRPYGRVREKAYEAVRFLGAGVFLHPRVSRNLSQRERSGTRGCK